MRKEMDKSGKTKREDPTTLALRRFALELTKKVLPLHILRLPAG